MKVTKSQLKELIRYSIKELASEIEDVNESKKRRFTVKEVRMWMKKLEENRYKKVYNSDARRVAWMVNNEGRTLDEMPISMKKKWTKAQYGRERYLATEFLKSKSEQLSEGLDLKKLETAIKDFKNKIKKQGRVTNARDEDHLKQLIKVYKQMGGKKIKEQKLREQIREIIEEGIGSLQLKTFKVFIKGYKKPFRVAAMDSRDAKKVAHEMMRNNKVKIQKVVQEGKLTEKSAISLNLWIKEFERLAKKNRMKPVDFVKKHISKRKGMDNEVVKNVLKHFQKNEGKLTEAKFKKIILPNDKKSQTITSKIIKKMNLRYQKDYNMLAHGSGPLKAKGGNQVITILPKHYNKFLELSMKNKLNVRG